MDKISTNSGFLIIGIVVALIIGYLVGKNSNQPTIIKDLISSARQEMKSEKNEIEPAPQSEKTEEKETPPAQEPEKTEVTTKNRRK